MRCTYFSGPWKGMGAVVELVSEEQSTQAFPAVNRPSPNLDDLHRASVDARSDVNRFRTAWVEFGLKYGDHAKAVAKSGGHGYALWLRLKLAIEREKAAVAKLAEARLAMTPTFRRKEAV